MLHKLFSLENTITKAPSQLIYVSQGCFQNPSCVFTQVQNLHHTHLTVYAPAPSQASSCFCLSRWILSRCSLLNTLASTSYSCVSQRTHAIVCTTISLYSWIRGKHEFCSHEQFLHCQRRPSWGLEQLQKISYRKRICQFLRTCLVVCALKGFCAALPEKTQKFMSSVRRTAEHSVYVVVPTQTAELLNIVRST